MNKLTSASDLMAPSGKSGENGHSSDLKGKCGNRRTYTAEDLISLSEQGPAQAGFWVPNRLWATQFFLVPLRHSIADKKAAGTLRPLQPVIKNFKIWIESHSIYRMAVVRMIDEANAFILQLPSGTISTIEEKDGDATWIDGFDGLFETINEIITTSPAFNETEQVGTPLNGLLAVSMATPSGLALFHDDTFNAQFKTVLDAWNTFLKSQPSLDKLDITDPEKPGSWISAAAKNAGVWQEMQHDVNAPGYGFDSWNSFFLRKFIPGARPFLGNECTQVNIGCETTPWAYEPSAAFQTEFWIKDINYSLYDLFAGDTSWARTFEGGQIYQGFLSATHYHRWNSPVTGTLVRSWVQPGTYFAQRPGQGEVPGTWEGTESQPYLGHVAARAIFIFEHPTCGYVAMICIGMVEVSTCVISPSTYLVGPGADPVYIERGVEIGHFEFGGSTHMLLFQKDKVDLVDWATGAADHEKYSAVKKMGSIIATARVEGGPGS